MSERLRIVAIIPAAGQSRRMGRAKQLIDVAGRPMLKRLVEAVAAVDAVDGVIVVTRRAIVEALGWLGKEPACGKLRLAFNEDESSEMIDSVRLGLGAWGERASISPRDGILVCPGDFPGLTTAAFAACAESYRAAVMRTADSREAESNRGATQPAGPAPIIVAAHAGQRGHPIIFPAEMTAFVESPACDGGLNALTRAHANLVRLVDLPSDAVLRDADTPDDVQTGE